MSNKTQLQTNNTKLTSLITALSGKSIGTASVYTGSDAPPNDVGEDGDIYLVVSQ